MFGLALTHLSRRRPHVRRHHRRAPPLGKRAHPASRRVASASGAAEFRRRWPRRRYGHSRSLCLSLRPSEAKASQPLQSHGEMVASSLGGTHHLENLVLPYWRPVFYLEYSSIHPVWRKILKMRIWGIPPAGWPLLKPPSAQTGLTTFSEQPNKTLRQTG